jgi:hypothetical protein
MSANDPLPALLALVQPPGHRRIVLGVDLGSMIERP